MNGRKLDQFYTEKEVSIYLMKKIKEMFELDKFFLLEPSAGNGSFSNLFHKNSIAFDIDPKINSIIEKDFLKIENQDIKNNNMPIFTIGNPPFGKNSSLAIKFINKSSEFSNYIAFILPRTFKKQSVINKVNENLHLIFEENIKDNAFVFENEIYNVPCVFQIWEKRTTARNKIKDKTKSIFFNFVNEDNADFAIRRVGGLAGKLITNFKSYKPASHYYICVNNQKEKEKIMKIIIDNYEILQSLAKNTAGNPSLSKSEFVKVIDEKIYNDI